MQLDFAVRKATLSVTRGLGLARQSAPFDLLEALRVARQGDIPATDNAPLGWVNLLVLATFFVLREIEIAYLRIEHITISEDTRKVTFLLPVSKKDPKAVGCTRSWQCLCPGGGVDNPIRVDCPYHAAEAQLSLLRAHFTAPLSPGLPLFPTSAGQPMAKAAVVAHLEATVAAYGAPTMQPSGAKMFGGHSFRVTGAQRLAALGVDVGKIMVLARWAGESVLRYIRDAPLDNLPAEVRELEERRSLMQALDGLKTAVQCLDNKVDRHKGESEQLVQELCAKCAPSEKLPYVVKAGTKCVKVHWAALDGADVPPQSWKTRCGTRFGHWLFTRHGATTEFPVDALCRRCFTPKGSEQGEPSSSGTSSAQESSSEGGEDGS